MRGKINTEPFRKAIIFVSLIIVVFLGLWLIVYLYPSRLGPAPLTTTNGKGEKITIQSVNTIENGVYAQNVGKTNVTISSFTVRFANGTIESQTENIHYVLEVGSGLKIVTLSKNLTALPAGTYTIVLTSNNHASFFSPLFTIP
jgi:hypothetical protein